MRKIVNHNQVNNFLKYLILHGVSKKSIKFYKSDLINFLYWAENRRLDNNLVKEFVNSQAKTTPPSTINRRLSTLRAYSQFLDKNFMLGIENLSKTSDLKNNLGKILRYSPYRPIQERIIARFEARPKVQNMFQKMFFSRPNWYKKYHSYPIANYIHIAILVLFCAVAGFAFYDQTFNAARQSLAYPATPVAPNKYLSFQGRLTNNLGNPITTATNVVFKLYTASSGGSTLWDSTACSITPDSDGIFSTLLGSTCGGAIDSSVFSENASVWVGVTVGADAEATPRIQIATVAYALNTETLQGFPLGTGVSTVPYLNSSGELVIAAASPKIQSTSGTFAVEGVALTLSTPNTSNGIITINPDGTGTLDLTFEGAAAGGSANGFVNATNANITSGALYGGTVASAATGYNFIDFKSGASPTSKFSVNDAGNITTAGDLAIGGGNISPSAALTIGDNGDTLFLDSSDWDIGTTGDMTGIGAITADGTISFTGTTVGLGTSNSVTTFNIGTGTGGNTYNIATNNTTKDTVNIGSALDDVIINGAGTGSLINFANFDVGTSGDIVTAGDLNVNGDNITADGVLVVDGAGLTLQTTGAGTDITINATDQVILTDFASCTALETVAGVLTCGSDADSGGSPVWSTIQSPTSADLTLTMATWNTTFNWDPGADNAETSFSLTSQGEDTTGTGDQDQVLMALSQSTNGASDVDEGLDALLTFTNNDGNDEVQNAIRFDTGAAGTDFTYGINFDAADIGTAELRLENAEQIHNQTDGTITFEDGSGTDYATLAATALTLAGDLAITGGNITSAFTADSTVTVTGTLTANGTFDANGIVTLGDNGEAITIDSLEFDISGTTGAITINDDGDAGQLSIEGTILDINSLNFVGLGEVTTGAGTALTITPATTLTLNSTGDMTLTGTTDIVLDPGNSEQVELVDTTVLNVGGLTDVDYNAFANVGEAPEEAGIADDNDVYIGGNLEVDGTIYGTITGDLTCTDCLDFTDFSDTLALDTDTSIAAGTGEEITYNKAFTDATSENGFVMNFTGLDTTSGTTAQYGLYLDNVASTEGVDALIALNNADADDTVGSAILFTAGGAGTDFTYGINFDASDIGTAEIVLENAETIDNQMNGNITLGGSTRIKGAATSVLTGSIDPAASTTVTGLNTLFTSELVVGDRILVTGQYRTVTAIASDTSLTVSAAFSDNANDVSPDRYPAELTVLDSDNNLDFFIRDDGTLSVGTSASSHSLTGPNMILGGDLEIDGTLWLDGENISDSAGTTTVRLAGDPTAEGQYNLMTNGSWLIRNSTATATNNLAALMVDQQAGTYDIFTASAAGAPKFTITNSGVLTLANGETIDNSLNDTIAITANITNVSGDLKLTGADILDTNGNEFLRFNSTASAVDELTIANAAANGIVTMAATGDDTDIALSIDSKGADALNLNGTATGDVNIAGGSGGTGCTIANTTGNLTCSGDLTISGDDLYMGTNTANYFLMADGTNYNPTAPADARTGLGLVAGGTGDIWVEKAGDTMTGALTINTNSTTALFVEQNGVKDNTFIVDTTNGRIGVGTAPAVALDIDTGSNSDGLRLRGVAETVEISDIYVSNTGALVLDNTSGTDTQAFIDFRSEDESYGYIFRESTGAALSPYLNIFVAENGATDYTNFVMTGAGSSTSGFVLTSAGRVGVGTLTPAAVLEVAPNTDAPSSKAFAVTAAESANLNDQDADDITFTNATTCWTYGTGWARSGGTALHTVLNNAGLSCNLTAGYIDNNQIYRVTFTVGGRTGGSVTPKIGTAAHDAITANASYDITIDATANGADLIFTPDVSFNGYIDNVYIYRAAVNTGITNSGRLGVGMTPAYMLDVKAPENGVIARFLSDNSTGCSYASTGTMSCTSDIRLKKNIENVSYGLDTVMNLRPVEFDWKNEGTEYKNLGFIAQEVEEIIPSIVSTDETTGYKSLNQIGIIPILTRAIQDLSTRYETLATRFETKEVKTNLISPITNSDLVVDLQPDDSTDASKLVIKGENDEEVASIDATGKVTADSLEVNDDATISGTLYADKIESSKLSEIESLLKEVESNQNILAQSTSWEVNTATDSGDLIANTIQTNDLFVTGQAAVTSLFVSDNLTTKSINSLDSALGIQSLAAMPVEIMAGKIKIDTNGDVFFSGNVEVAGDLTVNNLVVANSDPIATESGQINSGEITTNAIAGKAVLSAGQTEIKINNPKLKTEGLIYVTPVSSTQNKVLYVKSKDIGTFTVGFSESIDTDCEFNWWIIDLKSDNI